MSPRTTSLSRPRPSVRPSTSTRERSTITSRRTLGKNRRDALVALVAGLLTATGAALAVPVPVLSISDGAAEYVAPLEPGEPLLYSYRQSMYQVTVYEDLARVGDGTVIERARSTDSRPIQCFACRGEPVRLPDRRSAGM